MMDSGTEKTSDSQKFGKTGLIDQLDKRNRERQQHLEVKHKLNKQHVAENESHDYFQLTFRGHVEKIESGLSHLTPNSDRTKLASEIQKIAEDIQDLQIYLSASTFFLSNYTVKSCQEIVNELKTRIEATKDSLLSKKKFNFRSKPTTSKTVVDGTASTPIQPAAAVHIFEWTIQNRQNEEIQLLPTETNGKDITISSVSNCILRIEGHPSSLQLSQLTNCIILCGPVGRSVFADNCIDCKLAFGCQQLRFHSSRKCHIYAHVTCRTIIEDCHDIQVAPYNYNYDNVEEDFAKAGLDLNKNNWGDVADFNWLSKDMASPNWKQMDVKDRSPVWVQICQQFKDTHFQ